MPVSEYANSEALKRFVGRIDSLPTLPRFALELADMLEQEDLEIPQVVECLENDPAISSKLLRVANSSYYGLSRTVRMVDDAVLILGVKQVHHIVLGISVCKLFSATPQGKSEFDREAFWAHCSGVGFLARVISNKLAIPVGGEEFSAGVLHDIGKIVFDQYFHDQFLEVLALIHSQGLTDFEAERRVFGITHAELGGWMLDQWKVPQSLVQTTAFHHNPMAADEYKGLAGLVSLADWISNFCGLGLDFEKSDLQIEDHPGWLAVKDSFPLRPNADPNRLFEKVIDAVEGARQEGHLHWIKELAH